MNYVEWLRVRNCLRGVAIVLGVLVVAGILFRISVNKYLSYDTWISEIAKHPGVTKTQIALPNGRKRFIIDDPRQQTRVVIDDYGFFGGSHIVVTEPIHQFILVKPNERSSNPDLTISPGERVAIFSMHISEEHRGKYKIVTIDTNGATPLLYYFALADIMALIVATVLGAPLAREADGHLELALTKPVSRLRFVLGTVGADAAGIVAASLMTVLALLAIQSLFEVPHVDFGGVNLDALLMGLTLPLAWYAMLAAFTASMKRSYGTVLGLAWPIALALAGAAAIQPGPSLVLAAIRDACWIVTRFSPLTYPAALGAVGEAAVHGTVIPGAAARISIELGLFCMYVALAIVQWRRVEA